MEKVELIKKIQEKKEFLEIPESIIERVLELKEIKQKDNEDKIKSARAFLRKYFSVFMTNKLVSGNLNEDEVLAKHISMKDRNYEELYTRILNGENVVIDLGCGMNGFSYKYLGGKKYIGVEAINIFVKLMNDYFNKNKFNAYIFWMDLFNLDKIKELVLNEKRKKIVFMFNLIDALENIERDYSKKLIFALFELGIEKIVLSWPTKSISGKNKFNAKRSWIINFVEENFYVLDDFEMNGERFLMFGKK
jgi:hypothetical protein